MENFIKAKSIDEVYKEYLNGLDNMEISDISKERVDSIKMHANLYRTIIQSYNCDSRQELFNYAVGKVRSSKHGLLSFTAPKSSDYTGFNNMSNVLFKLVNDAEKLLFITFVTDANFDLLALYNQVQNSDLAKENFSTAYRIFKTICTTRDNGFYNARLVDTELKLQQRLLEIDANNTITTQPKK